ncbi:hypothetical protein EVAR_87398_1 [Eumeta japonica]|uniref:Uncharacterized protein n=1 Tax=Eumeta variegata TaxID=151549 RepID=A0A4C1XZS5_EUMVA|nr:hypothetical protein EVAR_87398_1 [Eumeta japonica]
MKRGDRISRAATSKPPPSHKINYEFRVLTTGSAACAGFRTIVSASGKCNTENPMMLNPLEYGWEQQDTSYVFKWFEGDQLPRLISDFIKDVSDDNEDDEQNDRDDEQNDRDDEQNDRDDEQNDRDDEQNDRDDEQNDRDDERYHYRNDSHDETDEL